MRVKVIAKEWWNAGAVAFIVVIHVSGMQFLHVVHGSTGVEK